MRYTWSVSFNCDDIDDDFLRELTTCLNEEVNTFLDECPEKDKINYDSVRIKGKYHG